MEACDPRLISLSAEPFQQNVDKWASFFARMSLSDAKSQMLEHSKAKVELYSRL